MTEWTTIRVRQSAKDAAAERKPDGMTWSEYVAAEQYDPDGIDTDALVADLKADLAPAVADEVEARLR